MKLITVLVLAAACGSRTPQSSPSNSNGSGTVEVPQRSRHLAKRGDLEDWMAPLPHRGIVVAAFGMGGGSRLVVDADAARFTAHSGRVKSSPLPDVAKSLSRADVDRLWTLAEASWRRSPPDAHVVTDYRQVVVAVDGDELMILSAQGWWEDGDPAQRLFKAVYDLTDWK